MTKRLIAPDVIKGICIILMVYGHITFVGNFSDIQKKLVNVIYTFHMPLFLIISGYFFKFKSNKLSQLGTLVKTIGIPYIVFISLYLLGLIIIADFGITTNNKPPKDVFNFLEIIFLKPYGGYWFLHSLIVICFVFLFSKFIVPKENGILLFVIILSMFLWLDYFEIVALRTSAYFILGYVMKQIPDRQFKLPYIVMPFLLFFSALNYYYLEVFVFGLVEIINCLFIFCVLWSLTGFFETSFVVKILSWIGQNTLIVLVLHALFIQFFKPFQQFFLGMDSSGIFYSLSTTIGTMILSLISAKVFDMMGISKYLFGIENIYKPLSKS